MKRSSLALATAGLIAATVLPLTGVAAATTGVVADPPNTANLTVVPFDVKKATASWDDWTVIQPSAVFDAYLVTADDDSANGALNSDRSRFVDPAGPLAVTFDDLTAGTRYYFHVYAVDYTTTGVVVVPPSGGAAGDPIGYFAADGATLTIVNSLDVVKSGNNVTVSGVLTDDLGPISGATVKVQSDAYPFDGWSTDSVSTDGSGRWSKAFAPTINTRYRALYQPPTGVGGWTRNVTVEVRKKITVAVDPGATVSAGTTIKYTGKLGGTPANFQPPISGAEPVKACLQRQTGTKWSSNIKCAFVNSDGTYLIKHKPGVDQDGKYRIESGMGPAYADSWSKTKTITIN